MHQARLPAQGDAAHVGHSLFASEARFGRRASRLVDRIRSVMPGFVLELSVLTAHHLFNKLPYAHPGLARPIW